MTAPTPVPAFTLSVEDLRQMLREEIRAELAAQTPTAPAYDPTKFYTVPEFAFALNVCKETIYKDVQRGKLSPVRVGRKIMLPETELAAYQQAEAS